MTQMPSPNLPGLSWRPAARPAWASRSLAVVCKGCRTTFPTGLVPQERGAQVVARLTAPCPACRLAATYGPSDFL